ncbi:diphthine synthase [Candidatus Marsarchaeota G1 archaeon OSP_D]|jgi:diphthine synthase|uniref:Diphthine synthase n=4 Tax=Candidatus Marsarchaeota TaxID=1978152 RepID=A0A2R6C3R3_9ARCH|nr:MAG: diphthine synthase [Candidatus Marsarchaeota G1 archaeon OSP_D]PSN89117.1 MAG: diphthine synthase [Candidatus Marsarchaeota G1 archaeon OSP_C]PSO03263.1 MAG: diphthine synthase [Candidatus Marsarchaeota G2 archaeon ECH_B_SAG-E12]PSO05484.1 MAG: diphthine synthase [Candidatus Marsarchaeota G2 archaeon ECH_B_SAG-G06]
MPWLAFVGLGLSANDISLKALETLKESDLIFLDSYTSLVPRFNFLKFSRLIKKEVKPLKREDLEGKGFNKIIELAKKQKVAIVIPGDPFLATTHMTAKLDAEDAGITTFYVPGISIFVVAFSLTGLQIYKAGPPATILEPSPIYNPKSSYSKLIDNLKKGLHTLLLLDIDVEKNRFLSFSRAAELVLAELNRVTQANNLIGIGIRRANSFDQKIYIESLARLKDLHDRRFPQVLVIPGKIDPIEAKALINLGANQKLVESHARTIERIGRKIHLKS